MISTKPKGNHNQSTIPPVESIAIPDTSPRFIRRGISAKVFALIIAAQVGALFAFGVPYAQTLAFGKTVLLKCHTYDPRDPFKGDFVQVSYDVSSKVDFKKFKTGDSVFLKLKKAAACWEPVSASKEIPKDLRADEAVMKVVYNGANSPDQPISTGIEKFYVAEGTAQSVSTDGLLAEVALASDGMPVLRRMLCDGKEVGKN
jgi:uncharacterized membrane-anchored protein